MGHEDSKTGTHEARASLVCAVGLLVFVCAVTLWGNVHFRAEFVRLGLDSSLPSLTRLVLSPSPVAYILLFSTLIAGLFVKECLIKARHVTWRVDLLVAAAAGCYLLVYVLAMFLPLAPLVKAAR